MRKDISVRGSMRVEIDYTGRLPSDNASCVKIENIASNAVSPQRALQLFLRLAWRFHEHAHTPRPRVPPGGSGRLSVRLLIQCPRPGWSNGLQ